MRLFVSLLLVCGSILIFCQEKDSNNQPWTSGDIYLDNGRTLINVEFYLNPIIPGGILRVNSETKQTTLLPRQVREFNFYDKHLNKHRSFIRIRSGRNDSQFMELLYKGKSISLLELPFNAPENKSEYFILDLNAFQARPLNMSSLRNGMKDHKSELNKFLRTKELSLRKEEDAIEIIRYCDGLLSISD